MEESLARGLAFLRERQDPRGEFAVRTWRAGQDPSAGVRDHSVFVTACVLYALRHVDAAVAGDIARGASASSSARCARPASGPTGPPRAASGSIPIWTTPR
jgi:hypothetical protein